jgi:hypothetical protein
VKSEHVADLGASTVAGIDPAMVAQITADSRRTNAGSSSLAQRWFDNLSDAMNYFLRGTRSATPAHKRL